MSTKKISLVSEGLNVGEIHCW